MRLLQRSPNGELSFTKDLIGDDPIPIYAILSHTWGDAEVTYDDWVRGGTDVKSKAGYAKIQFCAEQAERDGLSYFWVDSCCINKTDAVELQDAINSMFRWYQNAAKCYVYLTDVPTVDDTSSEGTETSWSSFGESRWFTRGWTLQELLAPRSVHFFNKKGCFLGDKLSLEQQIHEITGISINALKGASLQTFSIEERMEWTKKRRTTRKEDKAYSLLGVFNVFMPLIYGEGEDHAFKRLRDAIYNATTHPPPQLTYQAMPKEDLDCLRDLRLGDPSDDKKRIENTKGGLLKDVYRWVLDHQAFRKWVDDDDSHLLWIKGDPGKGKTMLLCGIVDELTTSQLGNHFTSFFFCQATDSRINSANSVVRGLLYMLVRQRPSLIAYIRDKYDYAGKSLFSDTNSWVALTGILIDMLRDRNLGRVYLVIDALDECTEDFPKLLLFIAQESSSSSQAKWLVSSRNWPEIEDVFERAGNKIRLSLELNATSVSAAVSAFIQQKVALLVKTKHYNLDTREKVQKHLEANADNTFLWVALVCQHLEQTSMRRVQAVLSASPPGLTPLYTRMMERISSSEDAALCAQILAMLSVVYRPIALAELAALICAYDVDTVDTVVSIYELVELCGSFLTVRERTVFFVHQSAKDFLATHASDTIFPHGSKSVHLEVFSRSALAMEKILRRDLYNLRSPGFPTSKIIPPDPDPLEPMRYSCVYWLEHFYNNLTADDLNDVLYSQLYHFFRKKFLYWLEALSLCKSIAKGFISMKALGKLCVKHEFINAIISDATRFLMYHQQAIENSPLQIYVSALLFSPTDSLTKKLYQFQDRGWISLNLKLRSEWGALLQTYEGHGNRVNAVAYSPNTKLIASASDDLTVMLWDIPSGECFDTLAGHRDYVTCVCFSCDSDWVASASRDASIRIWDVRSGQCIQVLTRHTFVVRSIAFSHDSKLLASASDDRSILLWNTDNWECVKIFSCSTSVTSLSFSYDDECLVSGAEDGGLRVWDVAKGVLLCNLHDYSGSIKSIAFAKNSVIFASATNSGLINIWDASTGDCVKVLHGHRDTVNSISFSAEDLFLASGSDDGSVKIWNLSTGNCDETLFGHNGPVTSVAYSSSSVGLVTASADRTVKLWHAQVHPDNVPVPDHEGHVRAVSCIAFSHDDRWLASATDTENGNICIWEVKTAKYLRKLPECGFFVRSIAFSPDSTRFAAATSDRLYVWDTATFDVMLWVSLVQRHADGKLLFSADSNLIAVPCTNGMVEVWDVGKRKSFRTLKIHNGTVMAKAFSSDSHIFASGGTDHMIRVCNTQTGLPVQSLDGHTHSISAVTFSYDCKAVISASMDKTIRVWDTFLGNCVHTLNVDCIITDISIDPSGSVLHTDHGDLDISDLQLPGTKDPRSFVQAIVPGKSRSSILGAARKFRRSHRAAGVSPDGDWITYNGENVLWIPSEYRPSCHAASRNHVGIGGGFGRVWTCTLDPKCGSDWS